MKPAPTAHLPAPELLEASDGHVSSAQFGDVYFSRADGEAETNHVFLGGNGLPERFATQPHFTIGELGFGAGLNFRVAWQRFLATTNTQHLHYISVEKFPLTHAQLAALDPALAAIYPLRLPGWHRVHLERCTLTIGFGDAAELLGGIDAQVDAWFLDGFAPAKNPDMWSEALLADIARLSAPGATVATFTAAGFVKRGLAANGFAMEKVKGHAHKREMLVGCLAPQAGSISVTPRVTTALVIGAGISGCTVAHALAVRGMQVTVLEKERVAQGASGNPAAVLYPQLTKHYTPATAWHATGYGFMLHQLQRWKEGGLDFRWQQPGMLRVPRDGNAQALLESLQLDPAIARYVTPDEATALAGTPVDTDGIWLSQGSWIDPASLCRALLAHPNITLREHAPVEKVTRDMADIVVVCAAQEAAALLPGLTMPLGQSAGQVSVVPADLPLATIMSHRGYVIPMGETYLIGATYDHTDLSGAVTQANHDENLQHARAALPGWQTAMIVGGRTSLRATTPDRLPYVGAVGEGVYVSVGHGSRGMISAPLAAEIIASQVMGEMVPLTPSLRAAINPLRRALA